MNPGMNDDPGDPIGMSDEDLRADVLSAIELYNHEFPDRPFRNGPVNQRLAMLLSKLERDNRDLRDKVAKLEKALGTF